MSRGDARGVTPQAAQPGLVGGQEVFRGHDGLKEAFRLAESWLKVSGGAER